MVGQNKCKRELVEMFQSNKLFGTNLIIGEMGYGKKTLIKWLSDEVNIPYKIFGNTIEEVRNAIEYSSNEYTRQFYVFDGIDGNITTQNALLKFLEEPPKNVTIFILCEDEHTLLTTIRNRCNTIKMDKYSVEELKQFNEDEGSLSIFTNPSHLISVKEISLAELLLNINKIITKIDIASVSNALKLSTLIKSKDNPEGYDVELFVKAFEHCVTNKYFETKDDRYLRMLRTFQKSCKQIRNNPKYFMDCFVLYNYMEGKEWKPYI